MFQGSIPQSARDAVRDHCSRWTCPDIYVGCSGNFTVERVLDSLGRFRLHGNDVTIYSTVLGQYLAAGSPCLSVAAEYADQYGWLNPYLQSPADTVATVLLATRLCDALGREEHPYYRRIVAGYRSQWPYLHRKTVEKVAAIKLRLASFYAGGVLEMMGQVPRDAGFVTYPPFWAKGYEVMFKRVEKLFGWTPPEYVVLDEARVDELFEKVTDRKHWLFGVHRRLPAYEPYLRCLTQTTSRAVPIYIYASGGPSRVVLPCQETEPVLVPRLAPGEKLAGDPRLVALTGPQFDALRAQYLNPRIRPAQAALAVGVMVGDRLVGAYAFSESRGPSQSLAAFPEPQAYLLSDFPVRPTSYRHLAKLVLYAAVSRESQLLIERYMNRRIRSVITTAFTDRPVSMKYRGLFTLASRKEAGDGFRYQLNYGSLMGRWSLQEGYQAWEKKHGAFGQPEVEA